MKNLSKKKLYAAIIVSSLIAAVLLVTGQNSDDNPTENRKHVTATIFPIYDIAKTVGQGAVSVELLLPPGAEPHTFEPAPSDAIKIRNSAVVYAVGHGLDGWIEKLSQSAGTPFVTVDEGINLISVTEEDHDGNESEHSDDGYDPHYWLNANNAIIIAQNIAADLSSRYPEMSEVFEANLVDYRNDLLNADTKVKEILSGIDNRSISTFHGAFKYFSEAYDLNITAEFEPFPGRDPSARYLSELATELKANKTTTLYSEPNFSSEAMAVFASDNGLKLGQLDPLGGAPGRDSLIKTLLYNANEIYRNQK